MLATMGLVLVQCCSICHAIPAVWVLGHRKSWNLSLVEFSALPNRAVLQVPEWIACVNSHTTAHCLLLVRAAMSWLLCHDDVMSGGLAQGREQAICSIAGAGRNRSKIYAPITACHLTSVVGGRKLLGVKPYTVNMHGSN